LKIAVWVKKLFFHGKDLSGLLGKLSIDFFPGGQARIGKTATDFA